MEEVEGNPAAQSKSSAGFAAPHGDDAVQLGAADNDAKNDRGSCPPPSVQEKITATDEIQSHNISSTPARAPSHVVMPGETSRSLWIPDVPAKVTLAEIYDQLCGGAIERVESFPYRNGNGYSVSITFVEHSAAKRFLSYVHTPGGRLVFRGVPSTWKYDVGWNPRPQQMNLRILKMAHDPYIKARRYLVVRKFPTELLDERMLELKLGNLGGSFSIRPRVQKVAIDKERREATIAMGRISCAVQLMEAKIGGRWGEEFDNSTIEFGKDECERPIPGTEDGSPSAKTQDTTADPTMAELQNGRSFGGLADPQYDSYRSHKDFQKMRAFYIPLLPSKITLSDLVAQIRGGPVERVTLHKKAGNGTMAASVNFVHHSSAKAWYEYITSPAGRLRFPGVVWDWQVRWETSVEPIGRDIWHSIMDPAIKARRGFVLKNLSSNQEISVKTLMEDVLSQSKKRLSFQKFEIDWKKREATVIMASIGSAMGGITAIRRFSKYKGCRIEYLKDECEDPIPYISVAGKDQKADNVTNPSCLASDSGIFAQEAVRPPFGTRTLLLTHLPVSVTPLQLSKRIRGGALDNLQIHASFEEEYASASITFLDSLAAENYYNYIMAVPAANFGISWRPDGISNTADIPDKDARRVLILKGFPRILTELDITLGIEKVVKHSAWVLNIDQDNVIESITVKGGEQKLARVVMTSIRLAIRVKGALPKFWNAEFGRDDCENPLPGIKPA